MKSSYFLLDKYVLLDTSKPTTLSAGMGAFVAVAGVSVFIVIGTVMCIIRYRRRARLRGLETAEVSVSLIFSLLKKFLFEWWW